MSSPSLGCALALVLLTSSWSSPAMAAPAPGPAVVDGDAILREIDERAGHFKDQRYVAKMEIHKGGQLRKTLEFDMAMMGLERQLIVFKAPGDVAGMKVLMQDHDTLYVYSPEFKKVRRIAAHMQNQGFLGSTFTYEDMVQAKLSATFTAKLAGRAGTETTLELVPKAGAQSTYPKLQVVIDSRAGGVTTLRYYDAAGQLVREQSRGDWRKVGNFRFPTTIRMKDLKSRDETVIHLDKVEVDTGLTEETFSRRNLMRGT